MRWAAAIGTAKAGDRNGGARQHPQHRRPIMFATPRIRRVPTPLQLRDRPQVVNMPARPRRHPAMVANTGRQTAGPEGTANVDIDTLTGCQGAKAAYFKPAGARAPQQQSVGSRTRLHFEASSYDPSLSEIGLCASWRLLVLAKQGRAVVDPAFCAGWNIPRVLAGSRSAPW
jgi:hypothetical protein